MKRIKSLGTYEKGILVLIFLIVIIFTVVYSITISQKGFSYQNAILVPKLVDGDTIYSGKIQGKPASFNVSADKTIHFQYGNKVYGPYTVKEDSTAIPQDCDYKEIMTGIELYCGKELLFRGGITNIGNDIRFYNEDGSSNIKIYATMSNGTMIDENGNIVDPIEPSISTIMDLINGPKLTHKGTWIFWFCGVFISILTIISVLFYEELYRLDLAFRVRDADKVEPSDWAIASRNIGWIILIILILIAFLRGLQFEI